MSGETQIEIPMRHNPVSDPLPKLSLLNGTSSGSSTGMHSSSGSTGEDSSGEDQHHVVVLPKKIRLKESNNSSLSSMKSGSSLISMICNGNSRESMHVDDQNQDDDECSNGPITKDGGISNSLTSGENSDAEIGPDGDDNMGSNLKSDDSSKNKMFECDVCNMRFSNGANMRRHRMRHTGIKPFECKICQKRFFRKDHLAEHMGTHSKLLPFRCPICNKGFQRQIAMRAHFQNEHVGGSQDIVKACPLCAYKAGSMKSLRGHFYSRHGIDLDNPMPHSPSMICSSNGRASASPGPNHGEYSELAHALGFEERDKSTDSSMVPSHFLVPQIEISSNSSYPTHFAFTADSSYSYKHDDRKHKGLRSSTPSQNISPQSDSGSNSSNMPSSSDLVTIVVKKEVMDHHNTSEQSNGVGRMRSKDMIDINEDTDDVQEMPEDLSPGNGNSYRSSQSPSPKCSSSSLLKVSPLKSLLKEDWRAKETSQGNDNATSGSSRPRSESSLGNSNSACQNQTCDGEAITSSNNPEIVGGSAALSNRLGLQFPALHQCVYCGIIFPDKTLYFLHKGCHSDSNPWRCNICGESCSNVYDFNSHLLSKSHQ